MVSLGRSCFFFSSRRRHTRSYGDWSSDVCSSDLFGRWRRATVAGPVGMGPPDRPLPRAGYGPPELVDRSEERRVGKECRSRLARYNLDEKEICRSALAEYGIKYAATVHHTETNNR